MSANRTGPGEPAVAGEVATPVPADPAHDYYPGLGDRRLYDLAVVAEAAAPAAVHAIRDLVDHLVSLRTRAANAEANADRQIRRAHGHLDRVLGELLRRGAATDLVPDWWASMHPELAAEAEMRAGWPEPTALAAYIRELEELLHLSWEREEDAHERRRAAAASRDQWMTIARNAGARRGEGHRLVDPEPVQRHQQLEAERSRRRLDQEERARALAEVRAEALAELVRLLPRLPMAPKKLRPQVRAALARVLRPSLGEQVALPSAVVSDICRLAVEDEIEALRRSGHLVDKDRYRAAVFAHLGVTDPAPTGETGGDR